MLDRMELTAVDLFSGGGGASLGLTEIDDVHLVAAGEMDDDVREHYDRNLGAHSVGVDLTEEDALSRLCDAASLSPDEIDLIIGCPPCQRFSSLQDTTPPKADGPKDAQLNAYINIVLEARPRVVVFENVPGILTRGNDQYVHELKSYLRKAGYGFTLDRLNTADYGVPQARQRTIGLGILGAESEKVSIPEPTHEESPPEASDRKPWTTVRDAIADLPPLEAGETCTDLPFDGHRARNHRSDTVEFIRKIPPNGGSRTDLSDEEQLACHQRLDDKKSAGNIYGRMSWDDPAPTLTTRCTSPSAGRFVHPEQHRGISPREAARLMSFPDRYSLPEENKAAERLIGNAVPPAFIESVVGRSLSQHAHLLRAMSAS
jgi:DNA (cytosine-5)-methyltransferase 1